jgi:hypothetical protein
LAWALLPESLSWNPKSFILHKRKPIYSEKYLPEGIFDFFKKIIGLFFVSGILFPTLLCFKIFGIISGLFPLYVFLTKV